MGADEGRNQFGRGSGGGERSRGRCVKFPALWRGRHHRLPATSGQSFPKGHPRSHRTARTAVDPCDH